ncbi:MAG: transposase [Firmicutes bacterium]|nr:transposase [Bacillota bacterium]
MAERKTKTYTAEFKVQAVKLAQEIGNGRASIELGVPPSTLSHWTGEARRGEIDLGPGSRTPESGLSPAAELRSCRETIKQQEKEIARLRKENEF